MTSTTTTTTEKAPTLASENLHSVPLLILALAFLVAIVTLLMFGHEPDRVLYDGLIGVTFAIAGVTVPNRRA